ncbi:MAG: universal stress protein [Planctomycetota bacterium]
MAAPLHILVPTDFSDPSRHALTLAVDWARRFQGKLELLHVVPLNGTGEAEAKAALANWVPAAAAELVQGRRVVKALAPELGILEAAKTSGAGLMVIATHGRTGLKHVLLGSVTERVVQLAQCPVLTVRAPGFAFERP